MARSMTCPRCQGDIEYEVESADSGDGVWAQSGYVGVVLFEACDAAGRVLPADHSDGSYAKTACGCIWGADDFGEIENRASERAAEPLEP